MEQLQVHYVDLGVPRLNDLKGDLSVGRTEGNDIVLNHPSVSRKHAKFELRDDKWWITDLKSTDGVKVNGTLIGESKVAAGDKISVGSVQLELKALPSVNFSSESMFDNPSGTVIRRISDFNSEFGLDVGETAPPVAPMRPPSEPGVRKEPAATREKIFQVLVQVAKTLLETEELNDVLNTVMEIIFKYLPVERGLIILFDDEGNPVPKLTKFREGADAHDIPISRTILNMVAQQQVALMTSNALEDARLLGGKSIAIHGIRSAMCVPLWNRGRVIGAVQVDSPIHIGSYAEEDLDMLTAQSNFAYGGTLDKFIGDAVMAFFGAPLPQEDHADRAVLAGLMLQRLVGEWNEERDKVSLPAVLVRVGINSGPAVVGNVGTEKRVDYTVLGSSVNIASRLESGVAKPGQVVISQNTLDRVMGSFETESLGEVALKGLQPKMPVFAVVGTSAGITSAPQALQATTTR